MKIAGKVDKPWGYEEIVFSTEVSSGDQYNTLAVKKIGIDAEEMTSYHYHKSINEVLYVNKGMIEIRLENDIKELGEGEAFFIENEATHQIQNISGELVEIIEVDYPFITKENENVRVEDPYEESR